MTNHSTRSLLAGAVCGLLIALSPSITRASMIFNAAADFSATSNPNGVWSYGQSTTLFSAFELYTQSGPNNENHAPANLLDTWNAGTGGNHSYPSVLHNGTSGFVSSDGFTYAPGQLGLHPGAQGQYSIVRFTAPVTGAYLLATSFTALDPSLGSNRGYTDVHVLLNNASIFSGSVEGPASPAFFNNANLNLSVGDQLDFKVGYGSNLDYNSDSTGLDVTLSTTAVPEPASFALLGLASLGGIGLRLRRKRATGETRVIA